MQLGDAGIFAVKMRRVKLDISDVRQFTSVCSEFACRAQHVFIAVAMVGDDMRDVRAYLRKNMSPSDASIDPESWPSILQRNNAEAPQRSFSTSSSLLLPEAGMSRFIDIDGQRAIGSLEPTRNVLQLLERNAMPSALRGSAIARGMMTSGRSA